MQRCGHSAAWSHGPVVTQRCGPLVPQSLHQATRMGPIVWPPRAKNQVLCSERSRHPFLGETPPKRNSIWRVPLRMDRCRGAVWGLRAGRCPAAPSDPRSCPQHALRLAAFGQLHKVLGMDPLPSKMPKKPKNENPVDYTGTYWEGMAPHPILRIWVENGGFRECLCSFPQFRSRPAPRMP